MILSRTAPGVNCFAVNLETPEPIQRKEQRHLLALLHRAIALLTPVYRKTTGM
jgi:hypothetical protein